MHRDYTTVKASIVTDPKKLSEVCREVDFAHLTQADDIAKHLLKAARILDSNPRLRCSGLAAPQLGYNLRVIVVKNARGMFKSYVNPTIVSYGQLRQSVEGCFSFPGKTKTVQRARVIYVIADGIERRILRGMEAIAFQHEVDHLNGVLI